MFCFALLVQKNKQKKFASYVAGVVATGVMFYPKHVTKLTPTA